MTTTIVLSGIGGYGDYYLNELLDRTQKGEVQLAGVVDPFADRSSRIENVHRLNIPVFKTLEEFYSEHVADLSIISSPIQFHADQMCLSLEKGSHVLCEKPISILAEDVMRMFEARKTYERHVAIGYQWAYEPAIQALKKDILSAKFGKPKRLKTIALWPRNKTYYARPWAGKMKDAEGRWVLDSVAANATAHYLQNMFFVLGKTMDRSAMPQRVTAETYRANDIANFDTAAIQAYTEDGVEILFFATHAIRNADQRGPVLEYEFEHATVHYTAASDPLDPDAPADQLRVLYTDGREENYGSVSLNPLGKLNTALDMVTNPDSEILCSLEAATAHTLCLHGVHASVPNPIPFTKALVHYHEAEQIVWVDGLADQLNACYKNAKMPHELEYNWASVGREVLLSEHPLYEIIFSSK